MTTQIFGFLVIFNIPIWFSASGHKIEIKISEGDGTLTLVSIFFLTILGLRPGHLNLCLGTIASLCSIS